MSYKFKTKPYKHQLKAFELCKDKNIFALFMEQGTGKTKTALDKACYSYCEGIIDAVLVLAPNGVHTNWVNHELKKHIPDYVPYEALVWNSTSKKFPFNFDYLLEQKKLCFLAMNIEALATDKGKTYVRRFLDNRKVLFILDESSRIKTPKAQRTKVTINFGKKAVQRLIMTGTPITQSPFDLYTQFKFLDPEILGNQTYTAFKHEYGIFTRRMNGATGYAFDALEQYKNLDKLQAYIAPYSFRVTKEECLDLPEKIYQKYSVELTSIQRQHYDELKQDLITVINGNQIAAPVILTLLLRLQQITGGFLSLKQENIIVPIGDRNPKLDLMLNLIEDIPGKIIIWARFTDEIKLIVATLRKKYGFYSTVDYYGEVSTVKRQENIDLFQQDERCKFFVGNAHAGGIGITLTAANTVIYFSNDFSLETRLQSEDRAHRIGQKNHVVYIDIEAEDTVDSKIIEALRDKKNIADIMTGDHIKQWL